MADQRLPKSNFGTASLVDRRDSIPEVPLDIEEGAEIDLQEEMPSGEDVNIQMEEDGGVVVDFNPVSMDDRPDIGFYDNIAESLSEGELSSISSDLLGEYENNKGGRKDWEEAYSKGLELLGFKYEERVEPFKGASGVTHPLLAEAVTQFQAQAFGELLPAGGPVRTEIVGRITPDTEDQAERVRHYMNYQLTCIMNEYTPEFDQMLFYLPLAGSTFKKVYYDEFLGRAVSKFVPVHGY